MDTLLFWTFPLLRGGLGNLAAYLAAHVLLCLLPAFFIAGAMAALIPKETVTRFLGRNSRKAVSYPAAAAGSLLAVCSCTIVPLFAGIHKNLVHQRIDLTAGHKVDERAVFVSVPDILHFAVNSRIDIEEFLKFINDQIVLFRFSGSHQHLEYI